MNRTITSREAILAASKEAIIQAGLQALNIRDIARMCGVSVGSVYNYFPSKGDLTVAVIEAVWTEIMRGAEDFAVQPCFTDSVRSLFASVQAGSCRYPQFFTVHSLSMTSGDKDKGREAMSRYFDRIKGDLLSVLDQDSQVRADAFSGGFTSERLVDFTLTNLITLLMKKAPSCDFLLEILRRTLY